MSQVQNFGGNTTAVGNGSETWVWNDANNDGSVNAGDKVVRTHQGDASVFSYVVGTGEGLLSWGDPHLDNVSFGSGESSFVSSLNSLFQDAKDGTLNNASLLGAADQSLASTGARSNIGDYHADMKLVLADGRTSIEHDVVGDVGGVKLNENIDLNLLDASGRAMTLTIREIYNGNGGGGQMSIANTTGNSAAQAVNDASALPEMYEWSGANVRVGVRLFGDDYGTADYAHIIGVDGTVTAGIGKVTASAMEAFDLALGGGVPILQFANAMRDDDEPGTAAQPAVARATPAARS
jgi:hypothetical protein